jgi:hypothetical protein
MLALFSSFVRWLRLSRVRALNTQVPWRNVERVTETYRLSCGHSVEMAPKPGFGAMRCYTCSKDEIRLQKDGIDNWKKRERVRNGLLMRAKLRIQRQLDQQLAKIYRSDAEW